MRNFILKVILIFAAVVCLCEGVDVSRQERGVWDRLRGVAKDVKDRFNKFPNKVIQWAALKLLVPKYKEQDWGECDGDKKRPENPCVTKCVKGKCKKGIRYFVEAIYSNIKNDSFSFTRVGNEGVKRGNYAWLSFAKRMRI